MFIHYLAFLACSVFLRIFVPVAPALVGLVLQHTGLSEGYVWWLGTVLTAILLSWLTFLIMLLKSFIWNIYQAVLVVIFTGEQIAELEKKDAKSRA